MTPNDTTPRRTCSRCGAPLQGASKHTALCPDCRAEAKREGVMRPRICKQCGKTFLGGPRAWYCPDCRLDRRREASRRHAAQGTARKLGSIQTCERCGKPYALAGWRQRYCPDCAEEAVREAVAPSKREQASAYNHKHRKALMEGVRRCAICGAAIPQGRKKTTCSDACDNERKRRWWRQYTKGGADGNAKSKKRGK